MTFREFIVAWRVARLSAPPWVPGWLVQSILIIGFWVTWFKGADPIGGIVLIVGAVIIGVIRQIEKQRRDEK